VTFLHPGEAYGKLSRREVLQTVPVLTPASTADIAASCFVRYHLIPQPEEWPELVPRVRRHLRNLAKAGLVRRVGNSWQLAKGPKP
jgi:hypothetical protein